jgi:mRNA-degrading endonuclease RelE of RelBE toxin-antitoxin system
VGELLFDPEAFSDVPKSESGRILKKIEWLWDNRKIVVHHPLRHELSGFYKRVLGKYRIIYGYDNDPDKMIIYLIGTRDTIYEEAVKKFQ